MLFNVSRRGLLSVLAAAPMTLAMASAGPAETVPNFLGDDAAPVERKAAARLFGAAVRPDQLTDETPLLQAIRGCGLLVPEYHGQWSAVEWRRGNPWYGNYDAICDFAEKHGQQVRGHSLIWEQMTPDWARDEMLDQQDWQTVERHFATLLPRYSGRIREWIVVNEMIDTEHGDRGFRRTSFQRAYGNDYVRRALETARVLDPQAKLMINDYSLCYDNPVDEARRNQMLRLVERIKASGTPLDMVGLQGHLELRKGRISQPRLARFIADLSGMGVEVAITELDVLEDDLNRPIEERDGRAGSDRRRGRSEGGEQRRHLGPLGQAELAAGSPARHQGRAGLLAGRLRRDEPGPALRRRNAAQAHARRAPARRDDGIIHQTSSLPRSSCAMLSPDRSTGFSAVRTQSMSSAMPLSKSRLGAMPKTRSILEMSAKQWRMSPTR
jgi:endo-1,4-beta-xylanase